VSTIETSKPTRDWIKSIETTLLQYDEIPLFSHTFNFPWEQFGQLLRSLFESALNVTISSLECKWRTSEQLLLDLGDSIIPLGVSAAPLEGQAYWLMAEADVNLLMTKLLGADSEISPQCLDEELKSGFYRYIAVEVLYALDQLKLDIPGVFRLSGMNNLPTEATLSLDIQIQIDNTRILGRLLVTNQLRHSWKEYVARQPSHSNLSAEKAQAIPVELGVELTSIPLSLDEWNNLSEGDFIRLDQAAIGWDNQRQQGPVLLTLEGSPIFNGTIKDNKLTISSYMKS
jgi:flagellar motor switch protein FliN/FliY